MLARSKLNSIESKTFETLTNEISHENILTIIDEEKKCPELKESIRMMNIQRIDAKKIKLIEKCKRFVINEIINRNKIIDK